MKTATIQQAASKNPRTRGAASASLLKKAEWRKVRQLIGMWKGRRIDAVKEQQKLRSRSAWGI